MPLEPRQVLLDLPLLMHILAQTMGFPREQNQFHLRVSKLLKRPKMRPTLARRHVPVFGSCPGGYCVYTVKDGEGSFEGIKDMDAYLQTERTRIIRELVDLEDKFQANSNRAGYWQAFLRAWRELDKKPFSLHAAARAQYELESAEKMVKAPEGYNTWEKIWKGLSF